MYGLGKVKTFLLIVVVGLVGLAAAAYLRPLPAVKPTVLVAGFPAPESAQLPWPAYGQSAVGAVGYGLLAAKGEQKPAPIASITKVVTALAILERRPLAAGQKGPELVLGQRDVQFFEDYFARGGSVVKIQNGERLTQYEALQALLLPSGNNIADTLAVWAFGSVENYVQYANQMLLELGLKNTKVADASGFSPGSISTAADLVELGERVLLDPTIAEIVGQQKAVLPVAGEVSNVNWLLGEEGVVGIKTGNTDEAGGCFLFATNRKIENQDVTVIGAVLGADTRNLAISDSRTIIQNLDAAFEIRSLAAEGEPVGRYVSPWGASAPAVLKNSLSALVFKGTAIESDVRLSDVSAGLVKNSNVGSVTVLVGEKKTEQEVVLAETLPGPSILWRIFR